MVAGRMAEAAAALIESWDQAQRRIACRPFPDEDERRLWYYTPTDHGGLPLAAMNPSQQRTVHRLVATGLSTPGYVTVAVIMGLDNILDQLEGWSVDFERKRGRDSMLYYVTIFGDPCTDAPWGWRFGGHHVSMHYTIGRRLGHTPRDHRRHPSLEAQDRSRPGRCRHRIGARCAHSEVMPASGPAPALPRSLPCCYRLRGSPPERRVPAFPPGAAGRRGPRAPPGHLGESAILH
jgi:Protein of unknown function (DUF3500)